MIQRDEESKKIPKLDPGRNIGGGVTKMLASAQVPY
jgi:hypothetical protein